VGIDIHNLNLLAHAQDLGVRFDRTLAIGRQALFIEDFELEQHRRARGLAPLIEPAIGPGSPRYFEPLVTQWLGATVADSVDASAYEGARLIHDMNLPWPAKSAERGRYDAVLDFGCLEHVFNFPVAWRNCIDLCRVGGHVFHALPANNLSGHGFYQFSPELFFNLYRPENGFELRGLYFAMKADARHWWKVANPLDVKRRVNLLNSHEVYMLVIARKLREPGPLPAPQQSDYAQDEWVRAPAVEATSTSPTINAAATRRSLIRWLSQRGLIYALRAGRERVRVLRHSGIDLPAPDYQRVDVRTLIDRSRDA
jgi:SAM-dependent methyltransferase